MFKLTTLKTSVGGIIKNTIFDASPFLIKN